MRTRLILAAVLVAFSCVTGFQAGEYYQGLADRPIAIANNCGMYDPKTGEYHWMTVLTQPEVAIEKPIDLPDPNPRPSKKPAVPKVKR